MTNRLSKSTDDQSANDQSQLTDHLFFEFQSQLTDKLEKEVIAFLNTRDGGAIIIGVNAHGSVLGLNDADRLQLKIKYRLKHNISPSTMGLSDVVVMSQQSKQLIKIIIAGGSEKPYYLSKNGMSSQGCFIRNKNATEPMSNMMIKKLFAKRVDNSIVNIKSRHQNLTFEQLKNYYQEMYHTLNGQLPKGLDLYTKEGEYNYVAYLLSDKNDCSIKVEKYNGINRDDLIENEELGFCCLVKATSAALDKLKIENKSVFDKNKLDPVVMRESVTNAIVHNDFSSGTSPKIELFLDRLEITSVGAIPKELSEEDFFTGPSSPFNKELMRVFRDLNRVTQKGFGINLLLQKYPKSVYNFSHNYIRVILPFAQEVIDLQSKRVKAEPKVNKHSNKILLFCIEPKSRKDIQQHLKLKNRDHFRKNILLPLIDSKQLLLTLPDKPTSPMQQFYTVQRPS
ncbi:MAG: putative DNA binding domain-containing protein [Psychromonas sp.]|nr:putative DNA binding domain-containing protein [Psychromonas sp.]